MIIKGITEHGGDIYKNDVEYDFSTNINPFGMPNNIKEAIINNIDNLSKYPDPYCLQLRNAISKKEKVACDNIICGNGAADLIYQYVKSFENKKCLIIEPTFSEYEKALTANNAVIDYYYLKEEDDFSLNNNFINYIKQHHYDLIVICNPNNPTGLLINKDMIKKILKILKNNNGYLFLDECFNDLVLNADEYSLVNEINNYPNLFILKAFTKSYGMAGVRLGYGICSNSELLQEMSKNTQDWNVSYLAQIAGIEALNNQEFVLETVNYLEKEKKYLIEELKKLEFKLYNSSANYIFFKGQKNLKEELLKKKILIRSCKNYPGLNEYYYRIAVKMHKENEILIERMKEVING